MRIAERNSASRDPPPHWGYMVSTFGPVDRWAPGAQACTTNAGAERTDQSSTRTARRTGHPRDRGLPSHATSRALGPYHHTRSRSLSRARNGSAHMRLRGASSDGRPCERTFCPLPGGRAVGGFERDDGGRPAPHGASGCARPEAFHHVAGLYASATPGRPGAGVIVGIVALPLAIASTIA